MISSIINNPFRVLGLLAGATIREQDRQIKRLKQLIEADQLSNSDYSFRALGNIDKTLFLVDQASSKLNLDQDKLEAALFWFYIGNEITDEAGIDSLKEGDLNGAYSVWSKLVCGSEHFNPNSIAEVSAKNASAFSNLSTLILGGFLNNEFEDNINFQDYSSNFNPQKIGLLLKIKFLNSDFYNSFVNKVTDETFKVSKKDIQLMFLNNYFKEEFISLNGNIIDSIIFLKDIDFIAKEDFIKKLATEIDCQIENEIENIKKLRNDQEASAVDYGNKLIKNTNEQLKILAVLLGRSNFKYGNVADKIANEVLQCSIEYFNYHIDIDKKMFFVGPAIELAKKSQGIAEGVQVKERIRENLEIMERMKDREMNNALEVLKSIKKSYDTLKIGYVMNEDKVVAFINDEITYADVFTISISNKQEELKQYRELVEFLIEKMNFSQFLKIKYLCFWLEGDFKSTSIILIKKLPKWAKGILYYLLLLLIVALIWGDEGVRTLWGITVFLGVMFIFGWLRGR